jgi:hypothetical protein
MGLWVAVKISSRGNTVTRGVAEGNSIFTRDDIFTVTHKLMCYLFYYPEQKY